MDPQNLDALDRAAVNQIPKEVVREERKALERHSRLRLLHWVVVVLSLILTVSVWQYSKRQIALRTEVRFHFAADQVVELIVERLQKYELALWAGVSAIQTHGGEVDHGQWKLFAKNLDIEHRYPGILGIGVIHEVVRPELAGYLARHRQSRPDFAVHPPRDAAIYQPITFIEPEEANSAAVGLDMMHELNRRTALGKAKSSRKTQITGPIILVQDKSKTPGFLFFAPFYHKSDGGSVIGSGGAFSGAVYAPFVVKRLMEGVLDKDRRSTAVRISDGDEVIYDEISSQDIDFDSDALGEKRISLLLYGREWTLDIRTGLGFRSDNHSLQPTSILITGIAIDAALLTLFILLSRANRRGLRFADMATDALEVANRDLDLARQKAEEASNTKSTFLSTMSHEVRTPLTAIGGILELLGRTDLPEKQKTLVETGKKASEKLIKLLTDVLDVARLEANAVELWEREVTVEPLLVEWRHLAEGLINKMQKDVVVHATMDNGTPLSMYVDDVRLAQVINNLLDNACRFIETGEITIRAFQSARSTDVEEMVGFAISDTGAGIAEADVELIFDRFRQVDNSITREKGGAGLGLSICQELVRLMQGDIVVSSSVGVGTTFEIHLPTSGVAAVRPEDVY